MATIPAGRPGSTVRDLSGTVSDGDDLPSAIHDALDDGVQVYIPPGNYTGNHSDLDFQADDATIYGDPQGVSIDCDMDSNARMDTAGTLRIENIDIRGKKPKDQVKIDVDLSGGRLEWVNFNFPDGTHNPSDSYVARCDSGHGEQLVQNCFFGHSGNCPFYYSERDHENMPVTFRGCVFYNCSASLRGGDFLVEDCIYLADGTVPDFYDSDAGTQDAGTPRMFKFEGGGHTVIRNCDVTITKDAGPADGPCVDWGGKADSSNTIEVHNSRFSNHVDREIFDTASAPGSVPGDSSLSNVSAVTKPYFSGDSIPGDISNGDAPRTDIESRRWNPLSQQDGSNSGGSLGGNTGGDATPPSSGSGDVWTPVDGATAPSSSGGSSQSGTHLVLTASQNNPDANCDVSITADGPIAFGSESEPGTDRIETDGNGRYRATSVRMNPGANDSYWVSGSITGFSIPDGYDVAVTADGTQTTFADLVDSSSGGSSGSTGGDSGSGSGGSPGDSGSGSTGGSSGGSGSSSPRLLIIDGTQDVNESAAYAVTVTGTITRDDQQSTVADGGLPWDSVTDAVDSNHVTGIVGNGRDAYQFTGSIQSIDIDGLAGVRIVQP